MVESTVVVDEQVAKSHIFEKVLIATLSAFCLLMGCLDLSNLSGWIVIALTFLGIFYFVDLNQNKPIFYVLLGAVFLHQLISVMLIYFPAILAPIAQPDAGSFNQLALQIAHSHHYQFNQAGMGVYSSFIALFYRMQPSLLLGQSLSVVAFVFACYYLAQLVKDLGWARYLLPILLVFGLLPNQVTFGSMLLREPYQLLFFMTTIYYGMRWNRGGKIIRWDCFLYFGSAILLALLHKSLIVFLIALLPLISVFSFRRKEFHLWFLRSLITFVTLGFVALFFYKYIQGTSLVTLISLLQQVIKNPASLWHFSDIAKLSTSYVKPLVLIGANSAYQGGVWERFYFFLTGPSIFSLSHYSIPFKMVICYGYYLLKNILLLASFCGLFIMEKKRYYGLLLAVYLIFNFMWSLGTINYGTTMRHLMPSNWIVILLGLPVLSMLLANWRARIKVKAQL